MLQKRLKKNAKTHCVWNEGVCLMYWKNVSGRHKNGNETNNARRGDPCGRPNVPDAKQRSR